MDSNPYDSPHSGDAPATRQSGRWMPTLLKLLGVGAAILLLAALLLPAQRSARESGRANSCRNNMRNIALAVLQYEAEHGEVPPAYTVDAAGKRLHSWRTLILPFCDHQSLYDKIDLTKPWDDPANEEARAMQIEIYQCPSVNLPPTHTTYLAVVGEHSCFRATEPRKLSEITDGPNNTLMLMEVDSARAVHWMSPEDASANDVANFAKVDRLAHPFGANVVMVSGAVRHLRRESTPQVLRALVSIDGNDDQIVNEGDWAR